MHQQPMSYHGEIDDVMRQEQFVDLSVTDRFAGLLEGRSPSVRQALVAVADREETWWEAVRHALRTTAGDAGPSPQFLILCDRVSRELVVSRQAPPPSGMQIRVVDEVPFRFAVFDREVALTVLGDAPVESCEAAAVEALANCFESLWRRGRPVAGSSDPDADRGTWADEVQLAIMKRLVKGDTEDKIGRSLGMSRRTVAAHVARISRRLGSTSRTQLGYLIAQRNLLGPFDLAE